MVSQREQGRLLELLSQGEYMISIQATKDGEGFVYLTFDDEYSMKLTQFCLEVFIDKLQALAESGGTVAHWCLDADIADDDDNPGYIETDIDATEDDE